MMNSIQQAPTIRLYTSSPDESHAAARALRTRAAPLRRAQAAHARRAAVRGCRFAHAPGLVCGFAHGLRTLVFVCVLRCRTLRLFAVRCAAHALDNVRYAARAHALPRQSNIVMGGST